MKSTKAILLSGLLSVSVQQSVSADIIFVDGAGQHKLDQERTEKTGYNVECDYGQGKASVGDIIAGSSKFAMACLWIDGRPTWAKIAFVGDLAPYGEKIDGIDKVPFPSKKIDQ